jgi:Xaa-Pro aminopeptidase
MERRGSLFQSLKNSRLEAAVRSTMSLHIIAIIFTMNIHDVSMKAIDNLTGVLLDLMKRLRIDEGALEIEAERFPTALLWRLPENLRDLSWRDISRSLEALRAVKDEDEIQLVRRACKVTS